MSNISNISQEGRKIRALLTTDNVAYANLYLRALLSQIETYAIGYVTFYENTTARDDEIIAHRLGLLVIDNDKYEHTDTPIRVNFTGPGEFTTDDIPGIPFAMKTPILYLKAKQRLICDIIVSKGRGLDHCKWRPVANAKMNKYDDQHYEFTATSIGMLSPETLFQRADEKLTAAANEPAINLFFRPLLPAQEIK